MYSPLLSRIVFIITSTFALEAFSMEPLVDKSLKILKSGHLRQVLRSSIKPKENGIHVKKISPEFFIENNKAFDVEEIEGKIKVYHEKKPFLEHSSGLYNHFGLIEQDQKGAPIDRRKKVGDFLRYPYSPIALLEVLYKIDGGRLVSLGGATGYRNSLNQIITARHVLLPSDRAFKYLKTKKFISNNHVLEKERIHIRALFGYNAKDETAIERIWDINGTHMFWDQDKDFGIVNLPPTQKEELDDLVGSLKIDFIDDINKIIDTKSTIVGYPGEKGKELHYHAGEIFFAEPGNGVVRYRIDATYGNSGSPGFKGDLINSKKEQEEDHAVILTHSGGSPNSVPHKLVDGKEILISPYNIGVIMTPDLETLMINHSNISNIKS